MGRLTLTATDEPACGRYAASMPAWLVWLLPIPLATLAAIAWAAWSSRARGPEEAIDSVQAYERFRAAMTTPVTQPRTGRDPAATGQ